MALGLRVAIGGACVVLTTGVVLVLVLRTGSTRSVDRSPRPEGATFFVSGSGSNSNPGTRSRPWRTLRRAAGVVKPGDTVYVGRGTYGRERRGRRTELSTAGTIEAPIWWLRNPDEARPVFDGSLRIRGSHNRVSGFLFDGPSGPIRENGGREDVLVWINGDGVRLDHSEVRGSRWHAGVFVSHAHGFSLDHDYIHSNGIRSNLDHGVYVSSGARGCVRNDVIVDNRAWGVHLYPNARGVVVGHNTIARNGRGGIIVARASAQNLLVENVVAENNKYGIRAYRLSGTGNAAVDNDVFAQETNTVGEGMEFTGTTEETEPGFLEDSDDSDVCADH